MALRDKQETLLELGRIRCGQRVQAQSGALRPDKLDRFKFTSAIEHLIVEIAALYGGEPGPYTGDGVRGKQFQVVTDTNVIPVYLPQQKIDPFYEKWGAGACMRRCDGVHDSIHDKPCDCNPDERTCKPTTRLNVMLADVPGLGQWRLETHSLYAAMEMSQLSGLLGAVSMSLPARLVLESRARKFFDRKKQKVETRDYYVPIVVIDSVTARQIQIGGDALTQAIRMSNGATAAVDAAPTARAIEAGPAVPDPAMIERGLKAISSAAPEQMADLHARIKMMGSPQVLLDAFQVRLGDHVVADAAREAREAEALEAADRAREAEDAQAAKELQAAWSAKQEPIQSPESLHAPTDGGDRAAALMTLLGVAGKAKMGTAALDVRIMESFGVTRMEATAAQFSELAAELAGAGK